MLKLKTEISVKKGDSLQKEIKTEIQRRPIVTCKALNRRGVVLAKYLDATHGRIDKTRRRQKFWAGVELLRKATAEDITNHITEPMGDIAFEFKGITPSGKIVAVHIREEIEGKDKKLYLISTF